jgi:hypothetical protein
MRTPFATAIVIVAVVMLSSLPTGGQQVRPIQDTAGFQPVDPCSTTGSSDEMVGHQWMLDEEKKLPKTLHYLDGDESLADGLFTVGDFADEGFVIDHVYINLLGNMLHRECVARVSDENTITALQNQLKELQRQVSLLQKESHPKPAPKSNSP